MVWPHILPGAWWQDRVGCPPSNNTWTQFAIERPITFFLMPSSPVWLFWSGSWLCSPGKFGSNRRCSPEVAAACCGPAYLDVSVAWRFAFLEWAGAFLGKLVSSRPSLVWLSATYLADCVCSIPVISTTLFVTDAYWRLHLHNHLYF